MKEYYELLGLSESATDEEIDARYQELRAKYNEDRWLDGEAGNEAARMLTKLDVAYAEIKDSRKEQSKNTEGESSFEEITALIKENKINEAQARLDDLTKEALNGTICKRSFSIRKIGLPTAKNSLKLPFKWIPITRNTVLHTGK